MLPMSRCPSPKRSGVGLHHHFSRRHPGMFLLRPAWRAHPGAGAGGGLGRRAGLSRRDLGARAASLLALTLAAALHGSTPRSVSISHRRGATCSGSSLHRVARPLLARGRLAGRGRRDARGAPRAPPSACRRARVRLALPGGGGDRERGYVRAQATLRAGQRICPPSWTGDAQARRSARGSLTTARSRASTTTATSTSCRPIECRGPTRAIVGLACARIGACPSGRSSGRALSCRNAGSTSCGILRGPLQARRAGRSALASRLRAPARRRSARGRASCAAARALGNFADGRARSCASARGRRLTWPSAAALARAPYAVRLGLPTSRRTHEAPCRGGASIFRAPCRARAPTWRSIRVPSRRCARSHGARTTGSSLARCRSRSAGSSRKATRCCRYRSAGSRMRPACAPRSISLSPPRP